ncbi:MAG: LptF/LptG family permease [candidate division WOR-3 bacterium]
MKTIDRRLLIDLTKFALLALASVVTLYLLIDLFEELSYFTTRRVGIGLVLLNYLYELPSAITLLYPVSLLLAVFVVYGQAVRDRELQALMSAGVAVRRLFVPAIAPGLASVVLSLIGTQLVTIPSNRRLSDLRRFRIARRPAQPAGKRQNVYVALGGTVLFARELEADTIMRDLSAIHLSRDRLVTARVDAREAVYSQGVWVGRDVQLRRFDTATGEELTESACTTINVNLQPAELAGTPRPMSETPTPVLRASIHRMKRAGENVAAEEVEYHYRFSYAMVGLIVVLLGLPVAVRLRRGGVMFGLGLALLFSFLYWGAIQTSRAYGTAHIISPVLAAWLPNLLFGSLALLLLLSAETL